MWSMGEIIYTSKPATLKTSAKGKEIVHYCTTRTENITESPIAQGTSQLLAWCHSLQYEKSVRLKEISGNTWFCFVKEISRNNINHKINHRMAWLYDHLWLVTAISFAGRIHPFARMADPKPKEGVAFLKCFDILFLKWDGLASKATHTIRHNQFRSCALCFRVLVGWTFVNDKGLGVCMF